MSVDVQKSFADKPLSEVREAIQQCILIQARFGMLPTGSYQQFTDSLRNIALLAQTLGVERVSEKALDAARELNHRWKRPLTADNSKPLKVYLSEKDYYAWIAFPVSTRHNVLNDFLSAGSVLERAAAEPEVRALVVKVWTYWTTHQDAPEAWRYLSETLEALL